VSILPWTTGLIRLRRIYNFRCSMLVFTPFALCFVTLRGIFMHFSGTNLLTRCHSASSLFSAILCFRKVTQEIFSKLDKIKAKPPNIYRSFQKTEEEMEGGPQASHTIG
jgi:hypothetical protein